MIAHWPKGITKPGSLNRDPCHLIDLLPTWMELAGARHPGQSKQAEIPPLEGVSLSPTFHGKPVERTDPLFFEFGSGNAVRDGNWKLVRSRGQAWELYDLESDRTETRNLAEELPDRVNVMAKGWNDWFKRCTGKQYPKKGNDRKDRPNHE